METSTKQPATMSLIGHADLGINNIYLFNDEEEKIVPLGRTALYTATAEQPVAV